MPTGLDNPLDIKGWCWSYGDCPVSEIQWDAIHKLSVERTTQMEKAQRLLEYIEEVQRLAEEIGWDPKEVII